MDRHGELTGAYCKIYHNMCLEGLRKPRCCNIGVLGRFELLTPGHGAVLFTSFILLKMFVLFSCLLWSLCGVIWSCIWEYEMFTDEGIPGF